MTGKNAAEVFERAIEAASATSNRPIELRARLYDEALRLRSEPDRTGARLLELSRSSIPVFEEFEDERGLGAAWQLIGHVDGNLPCRFATWEAAVETARRYYVRAGWSPALLLGDLASAAAFGPRPVEAAIVRCRHLLELASENPGAIANVLQSLGLLEALRGRVEHGLELIERARVAFEEVGRRDGEATARVFSGYVERLAGMYEPAEETLRASADALSSLGDVGTACFPLGSRAMCLFELGRYDEAAEVVDALAAVARADDLQAQLALRNARALLLATNGMRKEAEAQAQEAVELSESTDSPLEHGEAHLTQAAVLRSDRRYDAAAPCLEQALAAFREKQATILETRTRRLVTELDRARKRTKVK